MFTIVQRSSRAPVRTQLQERAEVQEDAIATLQQELQRVLAEVRGLHQAQLVYQ